MNILGLGGLVNDPACAVLKEGRLASAVEQKKLERHVQPGELPRAAIDEALSLAQLKPEQIDVVAIARPFGGRGESRPHLQLRELFPASQMMLVEHHVAHAASAYFASPFEQATVLTLDHSGDFRSGALFSASGNDLQLVRESYYPDSLGDLYSRVTELLGYVPRSEEHKVQWLAAGGEAELEQVFLDALSVKAEAWPRADRSYFDLDRTGRGGFSDRFFRKIGVAPDDTLPEHLRMTLAASLQSAVEAIAQKMAGEGENLCLAGGLAMNALLVAAFERSGAWKRVFVQPASGNAGTALGAAWMAQAQMEPAAERHPMETLNLGPSFQAEQIKQVLENCKLRFRFLKTSGDAIDQAVELLKSDRIVAWMQGRMEFGPRALGNRSILASPLNPYSTENLNVYIKHREPYRKFAASVPAELLSTYFDAGQNAQFLSTVSKVRPEHRKTFESAVLGKDWIRVHAVDANENPLFHQLLHAWGAKTGLPVLYNTSFNLFSDPLVCTPRDAVRSFYSSGIDAMLVGTFLLEK